MQLKNSVSVSKLIEDMGLTNITPEIDTDKKELSINEINRPGLQLAGYFNRYNHERVQIMGIVEFEYLLGLSKEERLKAFENLVKTIVPCIIFTSNNVPEEELIQIAKKYDTPLLITDQTTSEISAEIFRWLGQQLAPMITVHGVLIDVFGEGVLITGESGIGKSEAALELVKRGHRLVSDDIVEIRRVSDVELVGSSPAITKHFIELRGIGIIDVKTLYGIQNVEDFHDIGLVIQLSEWDKEKEYDRLGLESESVEYLGIKVPSHSIPIRPGRNLAVIVETAAINHRQINMGYNAAHELYRRVQENLIEHKKNN